MNNNININLNNLNNLNYVTLSNTVPYALDDTINYYYILQHSDMDCFITYAEIMQCYISHFLNSKCVRILEKPLYAYLLEKGLSTLTHIFKLLLLYTKNLGLTEYYCKQTLEYYVEFIEQNMQEHNDKLDYNNASKFCYIKTIYKLQKQYRKTSYTEWNELTSDLLYQVEEKEAYLLKNVDRMIEMYGLLLLLNIDTLAIDTLAIDTLALDTLALAIDTLTLALASIEYHILILTKDVYVPELGEKLQFIIDFIHIFNRKGTFALKYIYCLCIHLQQTIPLKATVIKKLISAENKSRLQQESVDDYIKWLII